jgi:thiol-disulfide isomerase/thioredoxin
MSKIIRQLAVVLASVLFASLAVPAAAQDRVRWTDIALFDGRTLTAAELDRSTVVVQMWASWCPFCARQNPHVQKLHEQSGGKLIVLALSIAKDPAVEREYLRQRGYTFAAAMAPAQTTDWFGKRRTLPEVYVVQPGGRIVLREEGEMFAEDIQSLLRFAK